MLLSFEFTQCVSYTSIFVSCIPFYVTYVVVYVDDNIIMGSSLNYIDELVQKLNSKFTIKDLGQLSYFLWIVATSIMMVYIYLNKIYFCFVKMHWYDTM